MTRAAGVGLALLLLACLGAPEAPSAPSQARRPRPAAALTLAPDTLRLTVGGPADTLRVTGTTTTPSYGWEPAAAECLSAGFGASAFVTYWNATAACTVRVWASAGGAADTSVIIATAAGPPPTDTSPPSSGSQARYVAPGAGATSCTQAAPCGFATAIAEGSPVRPGDTVWMAAGTYAGSYNARVAGTPAAPLIFRARGRAIINGPLSIWGADTWWWDLEHKGLTSGNQQDAVYIYAARVKLINCYIHDAWGNAAGAQGTAPDFEMVGCVQVHNGLKGSGGHVPDVAHGDYFSSGATGSALFRDMILTGTQGYGLHFYTQGYALRDITVRGSIIYGNGVQDGCNATIGAGTPVVNLLLEDNAFWEGTTGNGCVWLGRDATPDNGPMTVRNNVIFGGDPALRLYDWASGALTGNVIVKGRGALLERVGKSALSWSGNAWYGTGAFAKPGATDTYAAGVPANRVIVRPNSYEPGRANIAVFNWSRAASAAATVPGLGAYDLRSADDLMGPSVATGTGPTVALPLGGAVFRAFVVVPVGRLPR